MKTLPTLMLAVGLSSGVSAYAADSVTAGGAIALCKTEAQAAHSDYVSSRSKRIKQVRSGYRIKMRVRLEDRSINANCEVAKDGTVNYGAK